MSVGCQCRDCRAVRELQFNRITEWPSLSARPMLASDIIPDWVWDTAYRDTQPVWPWVRLRGIV